MRAFYIFKRVGIIPRTLDDYDYEKNIILRFPMRLTLNIIYFNSKSKMD